MSRRLLVGVCVFVVSGCGAVSETPDGGLQDADTDVPDADGSPDVDADTGPLTITIEDSEVLEGHYDTTLSFEVRLNRAPGQSVTVDFSTVEDTAREGDDYLPASASLAFGASETTKTVDVSLVTDRLSEQDEIFRVTLENAQGADIDRGTAIGTILDDDRGFDLNGDGIADLLLGAQASGANEGTVYLIPGAANPPAAPDPDTDGSSVTGETVGDRLGVDVAGGDVNGDGHDDVVVAARDAAGGAGVVYVFYGPSGLPASASDADVEIVGTGTEELGSRLALADVTGDGIIDIIAGARSNSVNGTDAGSAYVIAGSDSLPAQIGSGEADAILRGAAAGDRFGVAVSTAGDVTGDGIEDVLIGAEDAQNDVGAAYVYAGGTALAGTLETSSAYARIDGPGSGSAFGFSVAGGADVTGDGTEDVLVGARTAGNGGVYLFSGDDVSGTVPSSAATGSLTPALDTDARFGFSVSVVGDANGDGTGDVVVGCRLGGQSSQGKLFVFFGGSDLIGLVDTDSADLAILGEAANDYFGSYVSTAIDVDGDGIHDIVAGADNGGADDQGTAYVFLGSGAQPDSAGNADIVVRGVEAGSLFGQGLQ